jgi:hydroxymethylpyrimidine pyrophosphatase-like HAD family hydrolase
MIATGRPIFFCQKEIETFNPRYFIELSGSILHDLHNKNILYSSIISESSSKKLIDYSKNNKTIFEMNIDDKTYFMHNRDLVPYEVKKYDPKKGYIHCGDYSKE